MWRPVEMMEGREPQTNPLPVWNARGMRFGPFARRKPCPGGGSAFCVVWGGVLDSQDLPTDVGGFGEGGRAGALWRGGGRKGVVPGRCAIKRVEAVDRDDPAPPVGP